MIILKSIDTICALTAYTWTVCRYSRGFGLTRLWHCFIDTRVRGV